MAPTNGADILEFFKPRPHIDQDKYREEMHDLVHKCMSIFRVWEQTEKQEKSKGINSNPSSPLMNLSKSDMQIVVSVLFISNTSNCDKCSMNGNAANCNDSENNNFSLDELLADLRNWIAIDKCMARTLESENRHTKTAEKPVKTALTITRSDPIVDLPKSRKPVKKTANFKRSRYLESRNNLKNVQFIPVIKSKNKLVPIVDVGIISPIYKNGEIEPNCVKLLSPVDFQNKIRSSTPTIKLATQHVKIVSPVEMLNKHNGLVTSEHQYSLPSDFNQDYTPTIATAISAHRGVDDYQCANYMAQMSSINLKKNVQNDKQTLLKQLSLQPSTVILRSNPSLIRLTPEEQQKETEVIMFLAQLKRQNSQVFV